MKTAENSTTVADAAAHELIDSPTSPQPKEDGISFPVPDLGSGPPEGRPWPLASMAELLAEPEESEDWLVEGIVPCGGLTMVSADPKVGKSTATRCLAVAIATGRPWLGRNTTRGPVLGLCLEDKPSVVRRHFAAMSAPSDNSIHCYINRMPPSDATAQLRAWVDAFNPRLVVIDPLFRFLRVDDVSDYGRVSRAFDPLIDIARHSGAALVLTHHHRKSAGAHGNEMLGSQAIFGSVDNAVFLYREGDRRSMRTQVRIGEDIARTEIRLDENGWVHLADAPQRDHMIDEEIIAALGDSRTDSMRLDQVHTAVGRRAEDVDRALERLEKQDRVNRTGQGRKRDPYRFELGTGQERARRLRPGEANPQVVVP